MLYPPASIIAVSIILPILGIITVILRFIVRIRLQPAYLGIDDWLVLAACVLACGDGANVVANVYLGLSGNDDTVITPERFNYNMKNSWATLILQKPSFGLIKLSVLFFFRRIFSVSKPFRVVNDFMIGLVAVWTVAFFFAEVFICGRHPNAMLYEATGGAYCGSNVLLNLWFSITDAIGDVAIIIMPYPMIRRLQIGERERWGIAFIFMLGALETVTAIVRMGWTIDAFTTNYGTGVKGKDAAKGPTVWSPIEAAVGVIAACLPAIGPLLRRMPTLSRVGHYMGHSFTRLKSKESTHTPRLVGTPESKGEKIASESDGTSEAESPKGKGKGKVSGC